MKKEKLEMKRDDWEYFRQYKQAPIKKRYLEILKNKEMNMSTKQYSKRYF
jgi:hypothetical protein